MNMSGCINELAGALAKAQGEMTNAKKESENPFFRSKYADLATCIDTVREPLSKNGLAVVQAPIVSEGMIRLTTTLLHSSGQWIQGDPLAARPKDDTPQSIGSGITYLRRYALCAILGLAAEDDDGQAASQGQAPSGSYKKKRDEQIKSLEETAKKNDLGGSKPVDNRVENPRDTVSDFARAKAVVEAATYGTADGWVKWRTKMSDGINKSLDSKKMSSDEAKSLQVLMDKKEVEFGVATLANRF